MSSFASDIMNRAVAKIQADSKANLPNQTSSNTNVDNNTGAGLSVNRALGRLGLPTIGSLGGASPQPNTTAVTTAKNFYGLDHDNFQKQALDPELKAIHDKTGGPGKAYVDYAAARRNEYHIGKDAEALWADKMGSKDSRPNLGNRILSESDISTAVTKETAMMKKAGVPQSDIDTYAKKRTDELGFSSNSTQIWKDTMGWGAASGLPADPVVTPGGSRGPIITRTRGNERDEK